MKYSVDRIEENIVVLVDTEGKEHFKSVDCFKQMPCEGMIFEQKKSSGLIFCEQQTEQTREYANLLLESIIKK